MIKNKNKVLVLFLILVLIMISLPCVSQALDLGDMKQQNLTSVNGLDNNKVQINSILYTGKTYIAVGNYYDETNLSNCGIFVTSDDGVNWNMVATTEKEPLYDVEWCGDKFIAVGGNYSIAYTGVNMGMYDEAVYTSFDGIKWEKQMAVNNYMPFYKIAWNGEMCVAIGSKYAEGESSGIIAYSKDGIKWTAVGSPAHYTDDNNKNYYDNMPLLNDIKVINGQFVAVGEDIMISKNGIDWKSVKDGSMSDEYYCIGEKNNKIVVVSRQKLSVSSDLINWEEENNYITDDYKKIVYNGSYFLMFSTQSYERGETEILRSYNLINWEKISDVSMSIHDIVWDGGKYLIGTDHGFYSFMPKDITKIKVNGNCLTLDVAPIIESGRTLVPVRAICESIGATVDWNNDENKITVKLGENVVTMNIDSKTVIVNNVEKTLDIPAQIVDDRTMIPLRFIAESLGFVVNWNEEDNFIEITMETTASR